MTPCYFGPISYWKEIVNGNIIWDLNQNFTRQTIKNRTHIYGANKILKLSIPIKHLNGSFTIQEAQIENDFQWQKDHWKSIESSYKSSPFFQYYEDSLKKLYTNKYTNLSNFNFDGGGNNQKITARLTYNHSGISQTEVDPSYGDYSMGSTVGGSRTTAWYTLINYLAPNTTNEITFRMQFASAGAYTTYLNRKTLRIIATEYSS